MPSADFQRPEHRRTPLHTALNRYRLSLLATSVMALPAAAQQAAEWDCQPNEKGDGWDCRQVTQNTDSTRQLPAHMAAGLPTTITSGTPLAQRLGWVEKEQLSEQQKAEVTTGCCGMYVATSDPETSQQNPELAPVNVKADWQQESHKLISLKGNVDITQGNRTLTSDNGVIDAPNNTADFHGNIRISEPSLLLLGDSARLNLESGAVTVDNASFVFPEAQVRGTADKLIRNEEENLRIEDVTYTSCPPDSNAWQLVTGSVDVDTTKNVATARNVRIEVKDIPVIYLPWVRFPLGDERQTGVLFPNLGVGGRNGLDFSLPYYINLADNYDLTLTPRYIQQRGNMIEAEFRHLSSWGRTELNASWLGNDKGGKRNNDQETIVVGENRWWRNLRHDGAIILGDGTFTTEVDYTKVSDNLYLRDLGINTLEDSSTTHLRQKLELGYNTDHWEISLKGEQFQTIFTDPAQPLSEPYKQLPRLDANATYNLWGGLNLTLKQHVVAFEHSDETRFQTGDRARLDWGLEWANQWQWGFFTPGVEMRHISYNLDENLGPLADTSPSATAPLAYLDTGLFFERDSGSYTQTLEPRLFLLYAKQEEQNDLPDFDTSEQTFGFSSLWRKDRFSGGDRLGDSKQASFGLTSRFIDTSGREWLSASIGRIFYFEDRTTTLNQQIDDAILTGILQLDSNGDGVVDENDNGINERTAVDLNNLTRSSSPIAADLNWRISDRWQFLGDTTWDTDLGRIDRGSVGLRYNDGNNHIFNLGYRYTRNTARVVRNPTDPSFSFLQDQNINQGDISTIYPLAGNLSLIARWNYDFTNSRNLETFAGVEYNSCCWRTSIVARRWIRRDDLRLVPSSNLQEDEGIFFQIQLKGLAGTSSKVDDLLEEGIYGYQPEQQ
ncbi:MAG: LPS-assembly protein LptD [Porticoccaceae bacterium]|nr:LPS-assembly protein LptD [Porticoccaceae bacterium]